MRWFAVTVLASLALVITVNGVATLDQARQDARLRAAAGTLRPGLAMVFGGFVDERRLQKARLEVIERPRVAVFGSSRVREISGTLVHVAPGEFYNLAMSAAVVEDYVGLWSLLEKRNIRPDVAVFGVDAWVLNANHEQVCGMPWLPRSRASSAVRRRAAGPGGPRSRECSGAGIRPRSSSPTRCCRYPSVISSARWHAESGAAMTCFGRSPAISSRSRPPMGSRPSAPTAASSVHLLRRTRRQPRFERPSCAT